MAPFKLFLLAAFAVIFCVQDADGWDYWGWGAGLGAAAIAAPVLAPVALYHAPHGVPLCLFLKLLAIKTKLLVATPAIAIGSLVAGTGTGLLVGKLGTLAVLKAKQSSHVLHSHGWGGWSATHKIPLFPFHKWRLEYKHHGQYPWKSWKHGHGHGGHSFKIVPNPGWGWGKEPFFKHYRHNDHHHGHYDHHNYGHAHHHHGHDHGYGHKTTDSDWQPSHDVHHGHGHGHAHYEHGAEYSEGPVYETSGHGYSNGHELEWSESRPVGKVVNARSANADAKEEEPEQIEPLTNLEYLSGVMQFAAPVSDLISGLSGIFSEKKSGLKEASQTQTRQTRSAGAGVASQPWEFPGLNAKETEKFLEQHFDGLSSTDPEEGKSLVRVLRQAYSQVIHHLGGNSGTIPEFKPMPDLNQTESTTTTEKPANKKAEDEADLEKIIEQIPDEVQTYFSLLSSFDNETCFEKVICDIHTRVKEEDESNFTPYERNVLAVFALLKELPKDKIHDPTSTKYLNAAKFGEEHLSSALCRQAYPQCQYNTNEIMDMGSELDQASQYSVPNHKLNDLDPVMDVPRV